MQYYTKINTLYKRFSEEHNLPEALKPLRNKIIIGDYSNKETKLLQELEWKCTEKIDGTNMSVHLYLEDQRIQVDIQGKTPEAGIPKNLQYRMAELFISNPRPREYFLEKLQAGADITIFGEGYGKGIQKGGRYIKDGVDFIVFDIKIDQWWLQREQVEKICKDLDLKIVPLIGYMNIHDAEQLVVHGFKSKIAEDPDLDAEGLVCEAPLGMLDRGGNRIITKIKTKDYRDLTRVFIPGANFASAVSELYCRTNIALQDGKLP